STTVTSADGTSVTRSMRYDKLGRVTEVWEGTPKDGQDKTDAYTKSVIGYGYDADGNTTSVTYPDGTTLTQAFDQAGRMVKATDAAGAVTGYTYHPETGRLEKAVQKAEDGTELASAAYTYDTLGRPESVRHGNKTTTRYEYYDNDQPKTQTLTRDDGGEVLARTAYTYNSHGSLETRTDTRPKVKDDGTIDTDGGGGNVTTHTVHTYDAYDRLIRTVLHDGDNAQGKLVKQTDYTINASGDITHTKTTNADGTVSETVNEIDAAGRRTTVTTGDVKAGQVWDAAGNLITDRHGTTITYNPDNKPVALTPSQPGQATVAVAYWADGSRRSATTTDREGTEQTTTYHYNPTGTLANDTTGNLTASYLTTPQGREHRTLTQDGTPTTDTTGTGYLLADRRGNTTALVNHEGAITDSYYYEDYGRPTTHHTTPLTPNPQADRAHTNPIQYGGEYTNNWDHTQYTPARTYTPDGYFTTRDTWQLHNRYQYTDADPINHTDPTGHGPRNVKPLSYTNQYHAGGTRSDTESHNFSEDDQKRERMLQRAKDSGHELEVRQSKGGGYKFDVKSAKTEEAKDWAFNENMNEKKFYHGTGASNADNIEKRGFDFSAPTTNGKTLGPGIYATRKYTEALEFGKNAPDFDTAVLTLQAKVGTGWAKVDENGIITHSVEPSYKGRNYRDISLQPWLTGPVTNFYFRKRKWVVSYDHSLSVMDRNDHIGSRWLEN
ncbi:hypothetical protein ABT187_48465, partial [Streptomyces sp. NPDC001817]|uniref:hypothetical protein n=1 Tax=Streptomyces sp. NPDC001817 TaxID=3154398 RepID=UPI00331D6D14